MLIRYLLLTLLLFQPAWAESEHRDHGAHVHGHASLNLALSGNELVVGLDSPAMNLLGFEHQASTEQDKKTLQHTAKVLRNPSRWLVASQAASCRLEKVDLDSELLDDGHHEEGQSDAHQNELKGQHEDDHTHSENRDGNEDHDAHADFVLMLHYHCDNPARLKSVELSALFRLFQGIEEIEVQWITDSQQSATELNQNNTVISLP